MGRLRRYSASSRACLAEAERTTEDRLRAEYFNLLPEIRRVADELEAEIRYRVLPISRGLEQYEQLVVKSRIKECESAIEALRRRQEGATFYREKRDSYTLTSLNDLAGVRVLAFPRSRLEEIDRALRTSFLNWNPDHVEADGELQAFKYHGSCPEASHKVKGEYQIVSMLTGLFWEVEHSAMYKPAPELTAIARYPPMQGRRSEVLKALKAFEEDFEALVRSSRSNTR
jgi:hypothetical protein